MMTLRAFATPERLAGVVRAACGGARRITALDRLRGGTKKGVYRLALDDGSHVVVYLWDEAENYWPADPHAADPRDPFSPATGIEPFLAAHRRLDALGVRVPHLYLADRGRELYPADVAVVEDASGGTLEELMRRDPVAARPVLARLAEQLRLVHADTAPGLGRVAVVGGGNGDADRRFEQLVLDRALDDLAEAAARDERIDTARDRLADLLHAHAAAVRPRAVHRLIHGELGPDHVCLDAAGEPVLIDIEGMMYADVEWEHVFLRIRFHEDYAALRRDGLDDARLDLYMLAMRLSLVAGPLRLLDGDFPDRAFMAGIAEYNRDEALALLDRA